MDDMDRVDQGKNDDVARILEALRWLEEHAPLKYEELRDLILSYRSVRKSHKQT